MAGGRARRHWSQGRASGEGGAFSWPYFESSNAKFFQLFQAKKETSVETKETWESFKAWLSSELIETVLLNIALCFGFWVSSCL